MAILGPMRLPFLILTPACVFLGAATAYCSGHPINFLYLGLALVGAVSAHLSVNALNEYDDFKTGLDFTTDRTPFSGGSGTLPKMPEKAPVALITGLTCLLVTISIGLYFFSIRGPWILPLGIVGIVNVVTYTRWATGSPLVCLIAPGLGFGPVMVMGTDFVLTGAYSWQAMVASLVPFFLVSNLLLLNQFPDVEADRSVGRNHLPIAIGRKGSVKIYGIFLAGAYATIVLGCISGVLPPAALMGLVTLVIAFPTARGVARYADNIPKLIPYMGKNVVINISTPVILAIGMFVGC